MGNKNGNTVSAKSLKKVKGIMEDITYNTRSYLIMEAALKDDFCNYSYEIIHGVGLGDTHKVSGSGIIKDDLRDAFVKFNVHLAAIDEAFKLSGEEVSDIDKLHNHELTFNYHVTAFKVYGSTDYETIVLIGNKYVQSAAGRIELKTPKISLDNLSSYKWYNELKEASDCARREVALYKEGKYDVAEQEPEEDDPKQTKMTFEKPATDGDEYLDEEMEGAKM